MPPVKIMPCHCPRRRFDHCMTALLVAVLVAACASGPSTAPRADATGDPATQARVAFEAGRFGAAAAGFERAAEASPARRDEFLLRAADAAFQDGDVLRAETFLAAVDANRLNAGDAALARVLQVAVEPGLPAHQRLGLLDPTGALDDSYRPLFHRLRAEALLESGQPYASAVERVRLGALLPDPARRAANGQEILGALQQLTTEQARRLMALNEPTSEIHGWLDLVATVKDALFAGRSLARTVADWEQRYPIHPAAPDVTAQLVEDYGVGVSAPRLIAVLLPESGNLAAAGRSVRDGIVTAFYGQGALGQLRFYDSGPGPTDALNAYRRAAADGADVIIGPLDRAAVTALILEADDAVPVLALNYATVNAPAAAGVFQFGLLPEDEARAAAERMLADGIDRAVTLTPNSAWGDRLRDAFTDHYLALGGVIFDTSVYAESANDFGATLERIVGLQAAQDRRRILENDLGQRVNFVPLRRPDLDGLFLAARPREGRLIKPQLAFHSAGDLPVYATSHVYAGTVDTERDKDLEAIRFCDAPWVIESQGFGLNLPEARETFSSAAGGRARLFALGYDAYRVLPYLDWLVRFPENRFPGATGRLRVADGSRVLRSPDCATFVRGRPRPVEPTLDEDLLAF
ncbi:MAG: penicillin-binding protein activator [Pseudomonadota bacterium]